MIIKKCNGLRVFWSRRTYPSGRRVLPVRMPGNRNISLSIQKVILRNAIHGTAITNRAMKIFLAERINASDDPSGLAFNQAVSPPDSARGMSVGWNFSLVDGVTSGPVASLHSDLTSPRLPVMRPEPAT